MASHVATAANDLVNLWQTKQRIAKEKAFDAKIDLKLAMMDSIGRIALGSSLGCIHTALDSLSDHRVVESGVIEFMATATVPIYDAFRTLFVHFGRAPLFPLLSVTFPLYTWLSPSWHASSRLVRNFMAQKVEERRREQDLRQPLELATDADCVLDMLLQQEKSQGKKALNENEMLDELLLLFLGGHDSTSAALFWLVKYMALDAEMQRRLHDEVCHVFSHDLEDTSSIVLSTLEDSEKLPILEAVVAETLRCAMISGAIGRYLTSDEVIMGRHVPKDGRTSCRNRVSDTRLTHGHE
ncbi:hypothetical protein FRC09_007457 [Ceratobasidium sp. 395]|nr:hypothetical protein FRC09_007457 [Ceratobasidium sp. 395]